MDVITLTLAAKKALRDLGINVKTEEKLLLSETEVLYDDANGIVVEIEPLEVDKVYNVYWDKQKYSCICKRMVFDEIEVYTLGNLSFLGEENANEPFTILQIPEEEPANIIPALDENNHIISIYEYIEDIQPINKKFMPNEYIEGITDSKIETLIKNRQIGSIDSGDILWDGDTTDKYTVDNFLCHVSDRIITADQVKAFSFVMENGITWYIHQDGCTIISPDGASVEKIEVRLEVYELYNAVFVDLYFDGAAPSDNFFIICVPNNSAMMEYLQLEKSGIYFVYNIDDPIAERVSGLYLYDSAHTIDTKFLPIMKKDVKTLLWDGDTSNSINLDETTTAVKITDEYYDGNKIKSIKFISKSNPNTTVTYTQGMYEVVNLENTVFLLFMTSEQREKFY